MRFIFSLIALLLFSTLASAQAFFPNTRVGSLTHYRTTVSTTTADAIPSASVVGNLLGWQICNDAVNTSTYLFVGKAADAATDGVQLDKGQCFQCPNCTSATLKLMKVKAQAASNGYAVLQYKQQ